MMQDRGMARVEPTLSRATATAKMRAGLIVAAALAFAGTVAHAAEDKPAARRDDLDVTMQIIVDPDAKLPDEVVRRIPLPARKPAEPSAASSGPANHATPDAAAKGQERAREAQELGKEMSQGAKERAQNANDQREQARREATEKRQNPGPPSEPPGRPPH